jgi:hypothetical protein
MGALAPEAAPYPPKNRVLPPAEGCKPLHPSRLACLVRMDPREPTGLIQDFKPPPPGRPAFPHRWQHLTADRAKAAFD